MTSGRRAGRAASPFGSGIYDENPEKGRLTLAPWNSDAMTFHHQPGADRGRGNRLPAAVRPLDRGARLGHRGGGGLPAARRLQPPRRGAGRAGHDRLARPRQPALPVLGRLLLHRRRQGAPMTPDERAVLLPMETRANYVRFRGSGSRIGTSPGLLLRLPLVAFVAGRRALQPPHRRLLRPLPERLIVHRLERVYFLPGGSPPGRPDHHLGAFPLLAQRADNSPNPAIAA